MKPQETLRHHPGSPPLPPLSHSRKPGRQTGALGGHSVRVRLWTGAPEEGASWVARVRHRPEGQEVPSVGVQAHLVTGKEASCHRHRPQVERGVSETDLIAPNSPPSSPPCRGGLRATKTSVGVVAPWSAVLLLEIVVDDSNAPVV